VDDLVALERRFWTQASGDLYRDHAAPELLMVFPAPTGVLGREAAIPIVDEAGPWQSVELEDVRSIELSPEATAIVYRATGIRGSGEPYRTLATSLYVRRAGRWLLALHQQTPLA
jgi:hypothetical protein